MYYKLKQISKCVVTVRGPGFALWKKGHTNMK